MAMEESKDTKMSEEKLTHYTKTSLREEAISLYNRGHYRDSDYDLDDMTYDHEFSDIREETD